jgi:hypothetical protein
MGRFEEAYVLTIALVRHQYVEQMRFKFLELHRRAVGGYIVPCPLMLRFLDNWFKLLNCYGSHLASSTCPPTQHVNMYLNKLNNSTTL